MGPTLVKSQKNENLKKYTVETLFLLKNQIQMHLVTHLNFFWLITENLLFTPLPSNCMN